MRAIELSEELERVSDLIDAEVEGIDSPIADVDARLLVRAVGPAGRERKVRLDCRAGLRVCSRRCWRRLRATNLIAQCSERNRRDYDGKIDNNNGELISDFHIFPQKIHPRSNDF